jgi:1,4-dihydroxy-6-naphthoate synthase
MTVLDPVSSFRRPGHTSRRVLDIACTPDSDDIFNFHAWESGRVNLPGWRARFYRNHISELNRSASRGKYDVVNISSVSFPAVADRYWILATGSSVGRGYGPMLVSKRFDAPGDLKGRRVAVADANTTGGVLAKLYCPGAIFVVRPYDRIADAILAGEVEAGVMIHEELVHFPARGLKLVTNLGAAWRDETGLPLPVGLNIVKRDLGRAIAMDIQRTCRLSLEWALDHPREAIARAGSFGRGCAATFVPMFSNEDTHCMPADVREGLHVLFSRLEVDGLARAPAHWEIIDA